MLLFFVFLLLWTELKGRSETHSLTYIYTAFSKPPRLPGYHEFTAIGLLDSRVIDYYDSNAQTKVPKQTWMAENLNQEYWDEDTKYLCNEQLRFKREIGEIMKRQRQSDTDTHILQKMRGCVGEVQPDGTLRFVHGMDMYSYDGNAYISFNYENQVWDAGAREAQETQRKWNDNKKYLKENTKNYLEEECINQMDKFKDYMKNHLLKVSPPEVFLYSQNSKTETTVILACLATGFYPKDVKLQIKKNGRLLTREDGVETSGVCPNEDDTFQRKDRVEILKSDVSTYTCEVIHRASNMHVQTHWDHSLPKEGGNTTGIIVGAAAIIVVLLTVIVAFIVCIKKNFDEYNNLGSSSTTFINGNTSQNAEMADPEDRYKIKERHQYSWKNVEPKCHIL